MFIYQFCTKNPDQNNELEERTIYNRNGEQRFDKMGVKFDTGTTTKAQMLAEKNR